MSRDALDTDIFRFSGPLIFQSSAYNIYGSGCAICALLIKCARSEFLEVGRKDWNAILNSARDLFMLKCSVGISKNTIAARVKKFIYDYIRYRRSLRKLALFFLFTKTITHFRKLQRTNAEMDLNVSRNLNRASFRKGRGYDHI